jgi:hypothetical protein
MASGELVDGAGHLGGARQGSGWPRQGRQVSRDEQPGCGLLDRVIKG